MIKFQKLDFDASKIYISSDFHYSHKNISQDTSWDKETCSKQIRPWNLNDMNDYIIQEINSRVPYDGLLIHMGDWSFMGAEKAVELRSNIICENVITCIGNHDHNLIGMKDMFMMIDHILYISIEGQPIVCCHYPLSSWHQQNKGSWNLYGHCHGSYPDSPYLKSLDVGFDTDLYGHKKYTLYSFRELKGIMSTKTFKAVDHHT